MIHQDKFLGLIMQSSPDSASSMPKMKHSRSLEDRNVLTTEDARVASFHSMLEDVNSNKSLCEVIKTLSPDACIIDKIMPIKNAPSHLLLRKVKDIAAQNGVSLSDGASARRYICEAEIKENDQIALLKRVPPPEIHRMQRGNHWIGDFYSSDLVVNALSQIGESFNAGQTALDYGCSSGSLLRVLAWCYPHVTFCGCDPADSSIEWAHNSLTFDNLRFFHQNQEPPIDLQDASIDLVTAISIFSHHGINAGKNWLTEIARVLKQGGLFILTYNDVGAIFRNAEDDRKLVRRNRELYKQFVTNGYVFEEVWVNQDDAGNVSTLKEWGNAFYAREIIYGLASNLFEILYHARRQNQGRQDVMILRRR